nr:aminotransferase class I/II-fold pyridoxal phosphate-dependent enzyme [Streptomyces sp. Act143]
MDAEPPAAVVDAVQEALAVGDTGYPPFDSALAEAWDRFASLRWDWRVDPASTLVVPSVLTGVSETLKVITAPGDSVVVNTPGYGPHGHIVRRLGRRLIEVPLNADDRIDLEALRAAFSGAPDGHRPRALLLCSPHNPTGTVHTAEELSAVAELAGTFGVRVVTNEIHAPLVPVGARHVPYLSLPGTEDAVSVFSASKGWHLSGFRGGLLVWGDGAAADMRRIPMDMAHELSGIGIIAQTAALTHGTDWLDGLLAGLDENRRLLGDLLALHLPAVRHRQPQGTYLAWLDCRDLGLGDDPATVFLDRGRVALTPGAEFGPGGEGHVRLNFATSPDILTEAVRRMGTALGTPAA